MNRACVIAEQLWNNTVANIVIRLRPSSIP